MNKDKCEHCKISMDFSKDEVHQTIEKEPRNICYVCYKEMSYAGIGPEKHRHLLSIESLKTGTAR